MSPISPISPIHNTKCRLFPGAFMLNEAQFALYTEKLTGCLLGLAAGDALGLPRERLSRARAARLFGGAPLRHRFIFGRGMVSDDTEHAIMVGESLLAESAEADRFAAALAGRMRCWLLGGPAGAGSATVRATLKLWLGCSPARSGIFSAGNGPAMRAPLLGAVLAYHEEALADFLRVSTRITHTDPRTEQGALLIALAAREGVLHGPVREPVPVLAAFRQRVSNEELLTALTRIENDLARGASLQEFADALGLRHGVSGYINHTVPVALYAWLRYPDDFRCAVASVILLGGDTDTTAAITGALLGAALGDAAIPADWLAGLAEWPKSTRWMRRLCKRLACRLTTGTPAHPPFYCWPGLLPRNLLFLLIVLYHAFRRLLPPY